MERSAFDRIARLLGGATSRRAGLRAALAALSGVATGIADDADARKGGKEKDRNRRKGRGTGGARIEGPCGDGSRKANICATDGDCCTGFCKKGLKNKDKQGRCRCVKKGDDCSKGQKCCGKLTCQEGICGGGPTPPPPPPACATAMVCASGCTYATVQAAIDALQNEATMQKVVIAGGEYVEDLTVTGKIELAACPNETVTLRNATADDTRARTILLPEPTGGADAPELVLTDIIVTAKLPVDATYGGGGIMAFGTLTLNGTTTVKDCVADSYDSYGGGIHLGKDAVLTMNGNSAVKDNTTTYKAGAVFMDSYATITMNDDATISGNTAEGSGGAIYMYSSDTHVVMNGRSAISNNTAGSGEYGGGIHTYTGCTVTMNDESVMSGNSAPGSGGRGGAIYTYDYDEHVSVILHGNASIENNTAELGGGIYLDYASQLTMDGLATMSGNTATDKGGAVYMNCTANPSGPTNNNYTIVTLSGSATITGNTATNKGGGIYGGLEYTSTGLPGKVVGGAGITGNTPNTLQCEGTDKPSCV